MVPPTIRIRIGMVVGVGVGAVLTGVIGTAAGVGAVVGVGAVAGVGVEDGAAAGMVVGTAAGTGNRSRRLT